MSLYKHLNPTITKPPYHLLGFVAVVVLVLAIPHEAAAQGIGAAIETALFTVVHVVFGWLTWLAGQLLDYSINEMVVKFGENYLKWGIGFTINSMWSLVRDIFNLTFIFGLVFIGLRMIFEGGGGSQTRRLLIHLILAALLVNFSLLITKLVVDFSNIAAEQLVQGLPKDSGGNPEVSGAFLQLLGLPETFNVGRTYTEFMQFSGNGGIGYIIGTMFLYIVGAFVFFGGAFLLIIRFAALNLYMLLSPLMFLGWVFPSAAGISRQYWSGFISRCFVAPAYLLMLYFSFQILSTFSITSKGAAKLGDVFGPTGPASFAQVVPPFVLTSIFLIASIVIAKKMSNEGAGLAVGWQERMMGKIQTRVTNYGKGAVNTLTYPAKALPRMAVNRAGKWGGEKFNTWQAKQAQRVQNAQGSNRLKRWAVQATAPTTWNSVDEKARGVISSMKDAQLGTGTTNTAEQVYTNRLDASIKQRQNVAGYVELKRLKEKEAELIKQEKTLSAEDTARKDELAKKEADFNSAVTSISASDVENGQVTEEQLKAVSGHLTTSQIEAIMKSDKLNPKLKGELATARKKSIEELLTRSGTAFSEQVAKLSIDQIETLGEQWINNNAHTLTQTQLDNIKKSKKFSEVQANNFVESRSAKLKEISRDPSTVLAAFFHTDYDENNKEVLHTTTAGDHKARKAVDVASLGRDVLLSDLSLPYITTDILEASTKTLAYSDRIELKEKIMNAPEATIPAAKKQTLVNYFNTPHAQQNWGGASKATEESKPNKYVPFKDKIRDRNS